MARLGRRAGQVVRRLTAKHEVMRLPPGIAIEPISESGCDEFFRYLNDHRSDNGTAETGYFIPISQSESRHPYEKEPSFRDGLKLLIGSPGWRRVWVARASDRQIVGHVDLRSHPVRFAEHRCLLGMGVHRDHRRLGVGAALLSHAREWAVANTVLEWLDLDVLSTNAPAIRLYLRAGFAKVGEVAEMFKMDGQSFAWITMTKRIREHQRGEG
jgi:ribosomal protein S18 acetylase RimI-like enzyme